jgi:hypothetical protein
MGLLVWLSCGSNSLPFDPALAILFCNLIKKGNPDPESGRRVQSSLAELQPTKQSCLYSDKKVAVKSV